MEPFIAEVVAWGCNFAPRGWAMCRGQLIPIASNTALFSLIGTIYGGDGRTTCGLPDLQGRMPMGPRNGPGLTTRRIGERGGQQDITLVSSQIPSHNHIFQAGVDNTGSGGPTGHAFPNANFFSDDTDEENVLHDSSVGNSGGGQAHSNMPPIIALNFCIALQGTYPSRS